MKRLFFCFVFLAASSLTVNVAFAFFCGNKLVSEGDTTAEVYLKCGEPFWKEEHIEKELSGGRKVYIVIEEWTYNFGPHKWLYHLRFENGVLKKIETLGYGYPLE